MLTIYMSREFRFAAVFTLIAMTRAGCVTADPPTSPPVDGETPVYTDDGALRRPLGFRDWVFVGASLGLSYDQEDEKAEATKSDKAPGLFHNVYLQPEAYRHYQQTGEFPEKTMLVMTNYLPSQKDSVARGGFYESRLVGLEVAVKDSEQFDDGWAYFNFSSPAGLLDEARAFPRKSCYDCHAEHASDDNVFVQFYPVLRRVKEDAAAGGDSQNPGNPSAKAGQHKD